MHSTNLHRMSFIPIYTTAAKLRQSAGVLHKSVRFNAEADSLNAAVLAPDVKVGGDIWYRFLNNVVTDIRQKAGQKCTASRRIFVPEGLMDAVKEALVERLEGLVVGYPVDRDVEVGPVVSKKQLLDVRAGIDELAAHGSILIGGSHPVNGKNAPEGKGYFVAPTVIVENDADTAIFHEKEVFGPVTTLLPYDGSVDSAIDYIAARRRLFGVFFVFQRSKVASSLHFSKGMEWSTVCCVWEGR